MEPGGHANIIAVRFHPIGIKEQGQGLLAGRSGLVRLQWTSGNALISFIICPVRKK